MPVDGELLRQCEGGMELFNRLLALEAECNQLIDQHKAARIIVLEAQHNELVIERRKLGKQLDDLRTEEGELNFAAQGIDRRLHDVGFALKMLKDHPPLEPYALASEIEEHNQKVAEAQKRVDAVVAEQTNHNSRVGGWRQRAICGNAKLAQLDRQVEDVWRELQRLKGVKLPPRRDAATGLPLP